MSTFLKMALSVIILLAFLLIKQGYANEILVLSCDTSSDCQRLLQPRYNITCLDRKCVCVNFSGRKIDCKPAVQKINNIIGGPCPCTLPNTECNKDDQVCYCIDEYMSSSDRRRCIPKKVELWENCEKNSQCFMSDHYSECSSRLHRCHCVAGFQEHNGVCLSLIGTGRPDEVCSNDSQCHNYGQNAKCLDKTKYCICQEGFIANFDQRKCTPNVEYNAPCLEENQCIKKLGPGSECKNGICTCNQNHFPTSIQNKTVCQQKPAPGDYCQKDTNCQIPLVDEELPMECVLAECNCKIGYHLINFQCLKSDSSKRIFSIKVVLIHIVILLLFNLKRSTYLLYCYIA